jgi:hypothetical protein
MSNDLDEQKRILDNKLKMHAASMGGNVRSTKQVSTLLKDFYKLDGKKISEKESEKKVVDQPVETVYELTQKALAMADAIMATRGVQDMKTSPVLSSTFEKNSTEEKLQKSQENFSQTKKEKRISKVPNKNPNFTSIPAKIARPLKMNDSIADILAKMYNFMVKKYLRKSDEHKEDEKYKKTLIKSKERRIEELIDLFKGKYKKSYTKDDKKQKTNKDNKKDDGLITKVIGSTKIALDTVKSKALSVFKKGADIIKKVAPTAAKVAIGATTAVGLSSIANIAKAESSGDPNQMNITSTEVKSKDTSSSLVIPGNIDITTGKKYDKKLTDMSMGEVYKLGTRRNEQLNGGGAAGKYQFEPDTMKGVALKEFGNNWINEKFSESNQEKLMQRFTSENASNLKKSGIAVTDQSLYAMHFTGSIEKTRKIVEGSDSTKMSEILGPKAASQNKRIANLTVGEYRTELTKKGFSNKQSSIPEIKPLNIVNPTSVKPIPEKMKSPPADKTSSVSMLNNTTNIINGGVTYALSESNDKSTAPLIDLQYG